MMQIYDLLPFWGWLIFAAIAFAFTVLISASNYVKKQNEGNRQSAISLQSTGQRGGNVVLIAQNLGKVNIPQDGGEGGDLNPRKK